MRASFAQTDGLVSCVFEREESDETVVTANAMVRSRFTTRVDQLPHPDVLALIAILCTRPWIGARLELDRAVSERFAQAVSAGLGLEVGPVDPSLEARERPADRRPALAFSGGTDCTGALTVMPERTTLYFLDRTDLTEGTPPAGLYRKDAALASLIHHEERGTRVRRVECDLEYLRQPLGFPHDLANAVPALFHADVDGLGSVTWGAVLESTYRVGATRFRDYAGSPFVKGFGPVFEAVGLPIANVVAGVSEVGTTLLVRASEHADITVSCIRGTADTPCGRCWKCARKITLDCALSGQWLPDERLDQLLASREARLQLSKVPVKHEGVVAFTARTYALDQGTSPLIMAVADKTSGYPAGYLTRHYPPALEFLPTGFEEVAGRLDAVLGAMTEAEQDAVRAWDRREQTDARDRGVDALRRAYAALDGVEDTGPTGPQGSVDEPAPATGRTPPVTSPADRAEGAPQADAAGDRARHVPGGAESFESVREWVASDYLRTAVGPARLLVPDSSFAASWLTCAELVEEILSRDDHATVVELGSGMSTVWMALALQRRGGGRVVTVDHDEAYLARTGELVRRHGVAEMVDLVHAPLSRQTVGGRTGDWYDTRAVLGAVAGAEIDVLFVDGPPGATGSLARSPALPLLSSALAAGATVVLDDAARPDEQQVRRLWMEDPAFAARVVRQRQSGRSWFFHLA